MKRPNMTDHNPAEMAAARALFTTILWVPSRDAAATLLVAPPTTNSSAAFKTGRLELETDPARAETRHRQIVYGMSSVGYERYRFLVPRASRRFRDPTTPEHRLVYAKRSWDGAVRKWRRQLHDYDLERDPDADASELSSRAAQSRLSTASSAAGGAGSAKRPRDEEHDTGGHDDGADAAAGGEASGGAPVTIRPDGTAVALDIPPHSRDFLAWIYADAEPARLAQSAYYLRDGPSYSASTAATVAEYSNTAHAITTTTHLNQDQHPALACTVAPPPLRVGSTSPHLPDGTLPLPSSSTLTSLSDTSSNSVLLNSGNAAAVSAPIAAGDRPSSPHSNVVVLHQQQTTTDAADHAFYWNEWNDQRKARVYDADVDFSSLGAEWSNFDDDDDDDENGDDGGETLVHEYYAGAESSSRDGSSGAFHTRVSSRSFESGQSGSGPSVCLNTFALHLPPLPTASALALSQAARLGEPLPDRWDTLHAAAPVRSAERSGWLRHLDVLLRAEQPSTARAQVQPRQHYMGLTLKQLRDRHLATSCIR